MLKICPDSARRHQAALRAFKMLIPATALVASLFGTPARSGLFSPRHPQVTSEVTRMGEWRLDIARDPFTGRIACRLRSADHHAFYRSGAVGFRFKRKSDVTEAVYRLDGNAPRPFRNDLPDLIDRGVPLDRGPIGNADEGIVWVPYERLAEANRITIEPRRDQPRRSFHFRGLTALHDIAIERGCHPESRFIE
ncbi:hypothetical protein [Novosphingobium sp. SG707]|uniref:hypothetical protein n=1 Tax=Novosphingobium sp. SG707 TaxID=2586996 RepID=UPI001444E59E|nr:hypothetical protein [Novosphingobium sp. SG707]NKJ02984.1 hypothetical protein [Novosphingobium sp. SG707]